jgi:adenine/guanine phosphoribosyltransferase-like PRPP-binding protein
MHSNYLSKIFREFTTTIDEIVEAIEHFEKCGHRIDYLVTVGGVSGVSVIFAVAAATRKPIVLVRKEQSHGMKIEASIYMEHKSVKNGFFVDDLIASGATLDLAIKHITPHRIKIVGAYEYEYSRLSVMIRGRLEEMKE